MTDALKQQQQQQQSEIMTLLSEQALETCSTFSMDQWRACLSAELASFDLRRLQQLLAALPVAGRGSLANYLLLETLPQLLQAHCSSDNTGDNTRFTELAELCTLAAQQPGIHWQHLCSSELRRAVLRLGLDACGAAGAELEVVLMEAALTQLNGWA